MHHIVVGPYDGLYFCAYEVPAMRNVYQPVGQATSQEVAIAEAERLNAEAKKAERASKRKQLRRFDDWVTLCRERGEKPVPEDDPVFSYADTVGLPIDFVRLAWMEFGRVYRDPQAKSYIDWRKHFQNAVRKNWFKLWYHDAKTESWKLTTAGQQLEIELKAKQQHEHRQPE